MAVFLTILKWVGIILLVLLALILVILLIVLLVPIKYNARAAVEDPERHEEFPFAVLREKSEVNALISWLFGAVKILVAFPGDELIAMKVFGKDIGLMDRLKKDETGEKEEEEAAEEKEEEEKEETSLEKRLEVLAAKAEKIINAVDYVHRVLTGSCGRRAFRKVSRRLLNILDSLMPDRWKIRGNVGLNDPCLNGRFSGFTSILMPFMDEHLKAKNGIYAVSHYVPLHTAPAGQKFGRFHGEERFTTKESERLVRLPMYYGLTMEQVDYICEKVKAFF